MTKTKAPRKRTIRTLGQVFALIILVEITFYVTPLEFLYSQYQFWFHAVQILILAVYSAFLFQSRRKKIVFPLMIGILGEVALVAIFLLLSFTCQNVKTHYYDLDRYLVSSGHRECVTGPEVGHYYQLEKRLLGNLITYGVQRKMVEYVSDLSDTSRCIQRFPDFNFEFNLCKARWESRKSYTP